MDKREKCREASLKNQKDKRKYQNEFETRSGYAVLKISGPREAELKFDKKKLKLVKSLYWKVDKSGNVTTMVFGKKMYFGQVTHPNKKGLLNHKNRDRYDFREENIVVKDSPVYVKSRKYKETQEAPPGVSFYDKKDGPPYWLARYEKGEHNKKKSYNIEKLGFDEAKEKAIKKREEWEDEYC